MTLSAWRTTAAALTIGAALPLICGDVLVASQLIMALGRIAAALS